MRRSARRDAISKSDGPNSRPHPPAAPVWLAAVMVGIGILVYADGLSGPFIFDDVHSIPESRHIRHVWPLSESMSAEPQGTLAGRPIVALSFALNYAVHGLNVRGYHIVNVAIHLASALLLLGIIRRALLSPVFAGRFDRAAPWLAAASATIWMVHPLQTDAVTYIVQRTELLMGLFYLLTLYCAIRGWAASRPSGWYAAAIGFCALGMGCKEVMVSAPLIVLLYDRVFVSPSLRAGVRHHWGLYAGLAMTWLVLAALNIWGPRNATVGLNLGVSSFDYLKTQAGVILQYLRLCVWPDPLVVSYDDWPVARSLIHVLPQGLLIVALLAGTVWGLWRGSALGFLGAWFFLMLAPTSSFVPIVTELAAERRMYLSLAAVAVLAVVGGYGVLMYAGRRLSLSASAATFVGGVLALGCVAALGYGTAVRNGQYASSLAIWTDTVTKRPANGLARGELGKALAALGRYEEAIVQYTEAARLKPDCVAAYSDRGIAYARLGRFDDAIASCTRAIEIKPDSAEAYNNRGSAYNDKGDYDRALADCEKAVELKPDYAEAYSNRGLARARKGDADRAIADFTKAIELKPDYMEAYLNRGNVREARGDHDGAIADFTQVIALRPTFAEAYGSRGVARDAKGDYDAAIADFTRVIEFKPDFVLAYTKRGITQFKKGAIDRAIADFTRAVEIRPDYADAYNNRGMAYCQLKAYDKAWADVRTCRRLGRPPNSQLVRALTEATGQTQ